MNHKVNQRGLDTARPVTPAVEGSAGEGPLSSDATVIDREWVGRVDEPTAEQRNSGGSTTTRDSVPRRGESAAPPTAVGPRGDRVSGVVSLGDALRADATVVHQGGDANPVAGGLSEGTVVDERYRIIRQLGEGSIGTVFEAEHVGVGRRVAIKCLRAEIVADSEAAARFLREAKVGGSLDHPNIAGVVDRGWLSDGTLYLVMQFARGQSLSQLIKANPQGLPWPQAFDIAAQLADALAAAHGIGVVHRDIKPDHVILEDRGDGSFLVRVLDFGLARIGSILSENEVAAELAHSSASEASELTAADLTRNGAMLGTLGYMAPEQLMGARVDHRADLYAVGILLWEMLSGRWLFRRDSRLQTLQAQMSVDMPTLPLTSLGQSLPSDIHSMFASLMQRDAELRADSAAALRSRLRRMIRRPPELSSGSRFDALWRRLTTSESRWWQGLPGQLRVTQQPWILNPWLALATFVGGMLAVLWWLRG